MPIRNRHGRRNFAAQLGVTQDYHDLQDYHDTHRSPEITSGVESCSKILPLHLHILSAFKENQLARETSDGWRSPMWHFVRLLKAHPELKELNAQAAKDEVIRTILLTGELFESECEFCLSKPLSSLFSDLSEEDAAVEFMSCWKRVRHIPGDDVLQSALRLAKQTEPTLPDRYTRSYVLFLAVIAHLQEIVGNANIALACRKIGELLGVSRQTMSRYRQWAKEDGFLIETVPYQFDTAHPGKQKATEFRCTVAAQQLEQRLLTLPDWR